MSRGRIARGGNERDRRREKETGEEGREEGYEDIDYIDINHLLLQFKDHFMELVSAYFSFQIVLTQALTGFRCISTGTQQIHERTECSHARCGLHWIC